ncbi:MAG: hypothetical protein R3E98_05445 [Gemmatimonadota bacterium]
MPSRPPVLPVRSVGPQTHELALAPALVAGLIAALVGGCLWAAAVSFTGRNLAVLAWPVGGLVAGAMALATGDRSPRLGAAGAVLTLTGLVVGTLLTAQLVPDFGVSHMIVDDTETLAGVAFWQLQREGRVPTEVQTALASLEPGDTVPDVLWLEMLTLGQDHVRTLSTDEREALAHEFTRGFVRDGGVWRRLEVETSAADVLFGLLALGTAWTSLRRRRPGPTVG